MLDDRLTEQRNPRSRRIDQLSPGEIVALINAEDRTVATAVAEQAANIARAMEMARDAFARGGRLVYVGAGTSGRLGVLDATEMPPTYGTDPAMVVGVIAGGYGALVRAREGAEDDPCDGAREVDRLSVGPVDFVLGIATSGTTPFVHGALGRARERGARTGFLLCTPPSLELLSAHDVVVAPLVGPEVITGSTRMKAGTATKLVLNTITTGAMVLLGKVYGNLMVDLQVTCRKLQDRGERILMSTLGVAREPARELLREARRTRQDGHRHGATRGPGRRSPDPARAERRPGGERLSETVRERRRVTEQRRGAGRRARVRPGCGVAVKLLGLMSGTSLDGVDAALLEVGGTTPETFSWRLLGSPQRELPAGGEGLDPPGHRARRIGRTGSPARHSGGALRALRAGRLRPGGRGSRVGCRDWLARTNRLARSSGRGRTRRHVPAR